MKLRLQILIILIGFAFQIKAQDIHFSQFNMSPFNLNPALTGVFDGDMRFAGNYRSQWSSVPVPYTTFSGSFDSKMFPYKVKNQIIASGFLINYDKAGDSELSSIQLAGHMAIAQKINEKNYLSAGLQLAFGQRRFKTDALTFDAQFNGDLFDPSASSQENFPSQSLMYPDISTGLNWRFQASRRTKFDVGAALFHINNPKQTFFGDQTIRLARKWAFNLNSSFRIAEVIDILPAVLYQRQGTYQELVAGGSLKYHLNQDFGKELGLLIGGWVRLQDAIVGSIGIHYKSLQVGISYDINTSGLQVATNNRGGPEIGVIYTITKVKKLRDYKSCPIF